MKRKMPPSREPNYRATLNVLRLVDLLRETPGGLTIEQIGAELEVSNKTAERYVKACLAHFGERLRVTPAWDRAINPCPPKAYRIGEPTDADENFDWRAYRKRMPRKLGA